MDLKKFDPLVLKQENIAIFVVATYGEGEPTDSAVAFHDWLSNKTNSVPSNYLSQVKYATFALGDSKYTTFCKMGKFTDEKLGNFGANKIFDLGIGDDNGDIDNDFESWKQKLLEFLSSKYLDNQSTHAEQSNNAIQYEFNVKEVDETFNDNKQFANNSENHFFESFSVILI